MKPSLRLTLHLGALVLIATGFAVSGAFARYAYDYGTNALTVSFARSLAAAITLGAVLFHAGARLPSIGAPVALGFLLAGYSYSLFVAIGLMPVALAILGFYTWPLIVGATAWWLGWERLTWIWPLAAGIAMVGLALAMRAGPEGISGLGTLLSLAAGAGWAALMMFNRKVVGAADSRPVTFIMLVTSTSIFALALVASGTFAWPVGFWPQAAMIANAAIYCVVIVAIFWASKAVGPVRAALVMYCEPIISLIANTAINDQHLAAIQLVGGFLVVGSLMLTRLATR